MTIIAKQVKGQQLPPNRIINGGMDLWQRGVVVSVASTERKYLADRWKCYAEL